MTANHDDLQRSLGRVEGNQSAMEARMDRFESLVKEGFEKVEGALGELKREVEGLKAKDSERKGAWAVIATFAAAVAAIVTSLIAKWIG